MMIRTKVPVIVNSIVQSGAVLAVALAISGSTQGEAHAAGDSAACADGTSQLLSNGPPYCAEHGGISGLTYSGSSSQPIGAPRSSGSGDNVNCGDGTSEDFASGPPFCANHGGIKGVNGSSVSAGRAPIPWGKILLGALIVGAVVAAASSGGGGGGTYVPAASSDYQWQWDGFRNGYGALQWACRGVQTGQFADAYHCSGQLQMDDTWPGQ